jgi:hypothetical protein
VNFLVPRAYCTISSQIFRLSDILNGFFFFFLLKSLELVMPIGGQSSHILKEFQLHRFLLTSQQVNDAVKQYQGLPTEVSQWAASSYQWHLWSLRKIMITILHQFYVYLLHYYTVTCFNIKASFSRQTFTFCMKPKVHLLLDGTQNCDHKWVVLEKQDEGHR